MSIQFPVFKVNKLTDKNTIDTIYVFYDTTFSKDKRTKHINKLFLTDPNNDIFNPVFDNEELHTIQQNNISVVFIDESIHIDDSIGVIKLKIFEHTQLASINEMYMFCLIKEIVNPVSIYQHLTQNDKLPLTSKRMNHITQNLYNQQGILIDFNISNKQVYSFADVLKLNLDNENLLVSQPLGQKIVFETEYPFIANPFAVTQHNITIERQKKELPSLNNNLLLDVGSIHKNTINLCLAIDVFQATEEYNLSTETTTKQYFPLLYNEHITTLNLLKNKTHELFEHSKTLMTPSVTRQFQNVNLFYNMYKTQTPTNKFSEQIGASGIINFKIVIKPIVKFKIPLDVIFKLIHATTDFPLIKFNPELRQENMYRLYTDKLTLDGRKIPQLTKTFIFKLMREIAKRKAVAVYANTEYKGISYSIICEFENNGHITIYPLVDFEHPITLFNDNNMFDDLNMVLHLTINPLIDQIKNYFEQSGLILQKFNSILDSNIEIKDIKLHMSYNVSNKINFNKHIGCISSLFVIEKTDKSTINMRLKRVSNFSKHDSQEALVIEKIGQGFKTDEIIETLIQNYPELNENTALTIVRTVISELEITQAANKRRALIIKYNPGFMTIFRIDTFTSKINITVSGINNILYINTLLVYLNSIIRITQANNSSNVPVAQIKELCAGKEMDDIEFHHDKPIDDTSKQVSMSADVNSFPYSYDDDDDDDEIILQLKKK